MQPREIRIVKWLSQGDVARFVGRAEFPSSLPSAHRNTPYRSKNCKEPEEIPVVGMLNPSAQTSF